MYFKTTSFYSYAKETACWKYISRQNGDVFGCVFAAPACKPFAVLYPNLIFLDTVKCNLSTYILKVEDTKVSRQAKSRVYFTTRQKTNVSLLLRFFRSLARWQSGNSLKLTFLSPKSGIFLEKLWHFGHLKSGNTSISYNFRFRSKVNFSSIKSYFSDELNNLNFPLVFRYFENITKA